MYNIKKVFHFFYFMIFVLALGLAGCGGGSGSSSSGSGIVLNITDAPVFDEDIAAVWVRFTQVIVKPSNDASDLIVVDVVNDAGDPWRDIELKSLVGGKTMLLGEVPLVAGDYSWIRLVIDPENTHIIETGGGDYLVDCSSCTESNLKLNRSFTIEAGGWIDFTIDFDLRKSITLRRPNQTREDFDYKLRPTLRILDAELASSFIHGMVTDLRTEMANPATPGDGCWVYVYEGDLNPDDVCVDDPDALPDPVVCPVAVDRRPDITAQVTTVFNDITLMDEYSYHTGFIFPGTYTVTMVCEPDDAAADEDLRFIGTSVVVADAVPGGATKDFVLEDILELTLDKSITSGDPFTIAGDVINYDYLVTNTGNVTVTGLAVSDDQVDILGSVSCPVVSLAPAISTTCTASYAVTADDVAAGSVTNTAIASGDGVISNEDMATALISVP